jgi:predicted transcriptional regulator
VQSMGKHRTRLKILANILSVVSNNNNGAKKTQIMYQAYLSYKLLTQYLSDMTKARLMTCENGSCYTLTQKGKHFLEMFNEYSKSRETINKHLSKIEDQRLSLNEMCPNSEQFKIKTQRNVKRT